MYALLLIFVTTCIVAGCKEENITQVVGPQDWQGPTVEWQSAMDADVRGTIGLDVAVQDSSSILRVKLYVDGREDQTLTAPPYRFTVVTDSLPDGVHLCEARAWDQYENLGISPVLRVNVANSIAQGPRVLWVPDSFQTIQAAINAATDYDTIRVRDGTYYETLNTFGKGIWIESEHGPLRCEINAAGSNSCFTVSGGETIGTIRGFWLEGGYYLVRYPFAGQMDFCNNILISDTAASLLLTGYSAGRIQNNLFSGSRIAVQLGYHWGTFCNNILLNSQEAAMWNAAIARNPLTYGYNLFWNNGYNYDEFEPGEGDLEADPLLDLVAGRLLPGSPCIDTGDPSIQDLDGTRSDIGPFGGPLGYR
jgi:hypothetical protein